MKETTKANDKTIREFSSLSEFATYIKETETSKVFSGKDLSSHKKDASFSGTASFEEALSLFENGWAVEAEKLNEKFNANKRAEAEGYVNRMFYDIVGFQASVPRYIQGIPTNMISKQLKPVKNKVVTLYKDISYSASTTREEIETTSLCTLRLIRQLEASGYRVNLNLIMGTKAGFPQHHECVIIRLKSASERLNISKLAFPLVHPSMLRRLVFRYIETAPTFTKDFVYDYGKPISKESLQSIVGSNGYVLPKMFTGNAKELDAEFVRSIEKGKK